jgi:hypothetical protein
VTGNAPVTILSPGGGGDATGPGGDTPTDPDDTPPTGPGTDTPPQGSPPGDGSDSDDPDDAGAGGGGGGPSGGGPSRGRQGELEENPGSSTAIERRELGAPSGQLPFTGLLLWLVALLGALFLATGMRGRQLTTA